MNLSMIVAHGNNYEIGLDGKLLWHVSEDLKSFKRITSGKPIILGRKTFESFGGKPLPNRLHLVITRNPDYRVEHESVKVFSSPDEVMVFLRKEEFEEAVVCGGATIYKYFLPLIDTLYLSEINWEGRADTFFPRFDKGDFTLLESREYSSTESSPSWKFLRYEKSKRQV